MKVKMNSRVKEPTCVKFMFKFKLKNLMDKPFNLKEVRAKWIKELGRCWHNSSKKIKFLNLTGGI